MYQWSLRLKKSKLGLIFSPQNIRVINKQSEKKQEKGVFPESFHLTFSSRRSAGYKVPPHIGGHHFLLCRQTNTKSANLCAASFVSKHGLKYHMESIHKTVPPGSTILHPHPSGIQNLASSPFPCGQCTHSFSSGTTLKHHIEHNHTSSNIPNSSVVQHLIPDSWG